MKRIFPRQGLYFVTSQEYLAEGRRTLQVAREAVAGGIRILQMREKHMARRDQAALGRELAALCRENGVTFIVNDDPALAAEVDADGVHLGQEDAAAVGIARARQLVGPDRIIGLSTHSPAQAAAAEGMGVDYIGFGPLFPTKTKPYHIGTGELREVLRRVSLPVTCIGGINTGNIRTVLDAGGRVVAAIRAIACADDVAGRVREFTGIMRGYAG